jgi:hypothetical protein
MGNFFLRGVSEPLTELVPYRANDERRCFSRGRPMEPLDHPIQAPTDNQFSHRGVVRVFHRYRLRL